MGKGMVLIGKAAEGAAPGPATAEAAAEEYYYNRGLAGNFAPRPPVDRWSAEQRERFEAELRRLEAAH